MLYLPVQERYDVRLDSGEINLIIDALLQMDRYLAEVVGCENEPQGFVQDHREALRALASRLDQLLCDAACELPVN